MFKPAPVGVVSDLGHWGVSGLATSYSPHQNDPLSNDQIPSHLPNKTLKQTYGLDLFRK